MTSYTPEEKARLAAAEKAEAEAALVRPDQPKRPSRKTRRIQKSIYRKTMKKERRT